VQARHWKHGLAVVAQLVLPGTSQGQAPHADFVHGVDYVFERMHAVRNPGDDGAITLVAYVYRPLKGDRQRVVVFNHGSTGGWAISPKEALYAPPRSIIKFFTRRGYTVVAPMRRGSGESSGTYREECAFQAHRCSLEDNRRLTVPGLREASRDLDAVIDQIVLGRLVPAGSRIILAGISRGGFLSLVYAGERPAQIKGVLNFVGGWLSVSNEWPAEENARRVELQGDLLRRAGAKMRAPTLWVYAARDPFYSEATTRGWLKTFVDAGGKGEYFFVEKHALEHGHLVATNLSLWEHAAEKYLNGLP
jgi:pimeloyl-ACP methyl ester carboxylesterase